MLGNPIALEGGSSDLPQNSTAAPLVAGSEGRVALEGQQELGKFSKVLADSRAAMLPSRPPKPAASEPESSLKGHSERRDSATPTKKSVGSARDRRRGRPSSIKGQGSIVAHNLYSTGPYLGKGEGEKPTEGFPSTETDERTPHRSVMSKGKRRPDHIGDSGDSVDSPVEQDALRADEGGASVVEISSTEASPSKGTSNVGNTQPSTGEGSVEAGSGASRHLSEVAKESSVGDQQSRLVSAIIDASSDSEGGHRGSSEEAPVAGTRMTVTGEQPQSTDAVHNQISHSGKPSVLLEANRAGHAGQEVDAEANTGSKEREYNNTTLPESSWSTAGQATLAATRSSPSTTTVVQTTNGGSNSSQLSQNISEQVLNVVQPLVSIPFSGESVLSMDLYPPVLGTVRAVIASVNGSVTVKLWAATEQGHALLAQALPDLREHLGEGVAFLVNVDLSEFGSDQPSAGSTPGRNGQDSSIRTTSLPAETSGSSLGPGMSTASVSSHLVDLLL